MLIYRPERQVFRNVAGEPAGGGADPAAAPAATPAPDPAPAPAPAPVEGPDLSWLPEPYRKDDGFDIDGFRTHYEDLAAAQAALADQPAPPESPDAYDLSPPEEMDFGDITPPDWFNFELDDQSPLLGELRSWMHEMKLPPEAGKQMTGLLAKYEASKAAQFDAQARAEMQALGQHAPARIQKIQRTIETRIRDPKQRDALLHSLTSADAVRAMEALISGASTLNTPASPPGAATEGLTGFARLQAARGG